MEKKETYTLIKGVNRANATKIYYSGIVMGGVLSIFGVLAILAMFEDSNGVGDKMLTCGIAIAFAFLSVKLSSWINVESLVEKVELPHFCKDFLQELGAVSENGNATDLTNSQSFFNKLLSKVPGTVQNELVFWRECDLESLKKLQNVIFCHPELLEFFLDLHTNLDKDVKTYVKNAENEDQRLFVMSLVADTINKQFRLLKEVKEVLELE